VGEGLPVFTDGAVADQLRVKAAIVGEVDLLGHQPIEGGADLGRGMIDLDGERRSLGEQTPRQREDGEQSERKISFTHEEAILADGMAGDK
jgi:hypothetical protein